MQSVSKRSPSRGGWAGLLASALAAVCTVPAQAGPPGQTAGAGDRPLAEARADDLDGGEALIERLLHPAWGDLAEIRTRGTLRVLVTHSRTGFYIQEGQPKGLEFEAMTSLERLVNEGRPRVALPVRVVFVPTTFERLLPDLIAGKGDVAAALLTVTEERRRLVDFSRPYLENVSQVVVSRKGAAPVDSLEGLSGRTVHVAPSSSNAGYLREINGRFAREGRAPIEVVELAGTDHEDLLEMAGAGMLDHTVTDGFLATLWAEALPGLRVDAGAVVRSGGQIAWAVRKGSPELLAALGRITQRHTRSARANAAEVVRKYLRDPRRLRNALTAEKLARVRQLRPLLQAAGDRYGLDWMLLGAQAFQESRLDPDARSHRGAVGLFQLLPATASSIGYPDIREPAQNVLAGAAYLDHLRRNYFDEERLSPEAQVQFSLAAYNAGPSRVQWLRRKAARQGLDPDRWFGHVEQVALRQMGEETVRYVANIQRYYLAYRLAADLDPPPPPPPVAPEPPRG